MALAYRGASRGRCRSRSATGLVFAYGVGVTFVGVLFLLTLHFHQFFLESPDPSQPGGSVVLHIHSLHQALEDAATFMIVGAVIATAAAVFAASFTLNQLAFRRLDGRLAGRRDDGQTARLERLVPSGVRLLVVDDPSPKAFCYALLRRPGGARWPRGEEHLVLTSALTRAMDDGSLRAVVAHEAAHIRAHDSRYLPVVRAARCLLFFDPVFKRLERRISVAREFDADATAATSTGDPLGMARALIVALEIGVTSGRRTCGLLGQCDREVVVARIERLVAMHRQARMAKR